MDWIGKIKQIKEKLGITTSELARRMELDSHFVADIERGKSKNPSAKLTTALITQIGINPFWLYTDSGNILISEEKENLNALKEENIKLRDSMKHNALSLEDSLAILHELSGIKKEDKGKIIAFIKSLKE